VKCHIVDRGSVLGLVCLLLSVLAASCLVNGKKITSAICTSTLSRQLLKVELLMHNSSLTRPTVHKLHYFYYY